MTTARPVYVYMIEPTFVSPGVYICRWTGTYCSTDYRESICEPLPVSGVIVNRQTVTVYLRLIGSDYVLEVYMGASIGSQMAKYTHNFGVDKPDCMAWEDLVCDKVTDDGQCIYSPTVLVTSTPVEDYCPRQIAGVCGQCRYDAVSNSRPSAAAYDLVLSGIANDGCGDCEDFFDGVHFTLEYCLAGSCCFEWTAEEGEELCGPGCDDTDSDPCINWIRLTVEYDGGPTKFVLKIGRRHAFDADVAYVTLEKSFIDGVPCDEATSGGWTITNTSADPRNQCDWSGIDAALVPLESIYGCAPKYKPCHYCEDPENYGHSWLITIPEGAMVGVGFRKCTTENCAALEGNTYELPFFGAEDLGFFDYCRYLYSFPNPELLGGCGQDPPDFCGGFELGRIWCYAELYIVRDATGMDFFLSLHGSGFGMNFAAHRDWLYPLEIGNLASYVVDCETPLEMSLTSIGGVFGTGCTWGGAATDAEITGSEPKIIMEVVPA